MLVKNFNAKAKREVVRQIEFEHDELMAYPVIRREMPKALLQATALTPIKNDSEEEVSRDWRRALLFAFCLKQTLLNPERIEEPILFSQNFRSDTAENVVNCRTGVKDLLDVMKLGYDLQAVFSKYSSGTDATYGLKLTDGEILSMDYNNEMSHRAVKMEIDALSMAIQGA